MRNKRLFRAISAFFIATIFLLVSLVSTVLAVGGGGQDNSTQDTGKLLEVRSDRTMLHSASAAVPDASQVEEENEGNEEDEEDRENEGNGETQEKENVEPLWEGAVISAAEINASPAENQTESDGGTAHLPQQAEEAASAETPAAAVYTFQPANGEEAAAQIDAYLEALYAPDAEAHMPRWEMEVPREWMPAGMVCKYVADDADFGAAYYTFAFETQIVTAEAELFFSGGEGTAEKPYSITSKADLQQLAAEVNGGQAYSGIHFRLDEDLDLAGEAWVPIGTGAGEYTASFAGLTNAKPFKGIFDGNHKTIQNLNVTTTLTTGVAADYKGLFGAIENASIFNLTIENATIKGGSALGVLVGYVQGNCTIENNRIVNSSVSGSGSSNLAVGGMVGAIHPTKDNTTIIQNNAGINITITNAGTAGVTGGFIGKVFANSASANNSAVLIIGSSVSGGDITTTVNHSGGLVGQLDASNAQNYRCTISKCWADIPISKSVSNAGGLIGAISAGSGNCEYFIEDSYALGGVDSTGIHVGGLLGDGAVVSSGSKIQIRNAYATGNLSTTGTGTGTDSGIGGLVGRLFNVQNNTDQSIFISNCYATGNISSKAHYTSGFIGLADNKISINNCWATGNVSNNNSSVYDHAGFIGYARGKVSNTISIRNCWSSGNVVATAQLTGGFGGNMEYTNVSNSYTLGSVYSSSTSSEIGGFSGRCANSTVTNCYAAGRSAKAFIGSASGTIKNCFMDTTTTQASTGATGKTTTDMTKLATFAAWNIQENSSGAAGGSGTDENPWYIDDGSTYPYLYYQYDGHSSEETNYGLARVEYMDGEYQRLGNQMDFKLGKTFATTFQVKTAGAARAFFPYIHETTSNELGKYDNWFTAETITIAQGKSFSISATTPYSIGAISQTGIVGFRKFPSAIKTSNRPKFQENDVSSYARVGDEITYTIQVSNYSQDYDWTDIVLQDPLPAGLTFLENSVQVNGEPIAKDSGTVPYYSFQEETNRLTVYLKDMPKDAAGQTTASAVVTFRTAVNAEAIGEYPPDAAAENLRNRGEVTGTLLDNGVDNGTYTARFDDRNTDPILPQFRVIYNGNGGTTPQGEAQQYGNYVFTIENDTVLGNDVLQFQKENAIFTGWNTQADGKGTPHIAGDTISLQEDVTLYAQWKSLPTLSFYKVDGDSLSGDATIFLGGAEFSLYQWNGAPPTGEYPVYNGDENWVFVSSAISSAVQEDLGLVKFTGLSFSGVYLLIETKAPTDYELPGAQWLFQVDQEGQISGITLLSGRVQYTVKPNPEIAKGCFLPNYYPLPDYELPELGGNGTFHYTIAGVVLIAAAGAAFAVYRIRNRKKTPPK